MGDLTGKMVKKMFHKKFLTRSDDVSDVRPKKSRKERMRFFLGSIVVLSLGAVALYYSYSQIYKPYIWREDVRRALLWIEKADPDERRELDSLPEIRRLEKIGRTLPYRRDASYKERSVAAISALELADHLGSPVARFIYGELLMEGGLIESGDSTAKIQFVKGHKRIASGVQEGDARSILYYGLMLNAGLGIEADPVLSMAVFRRVMHELDKDDLALLLSRMLNKDVFTVPDNDALFPLSVANAVLTKGGTVDRLYRIQVCDAFSTPNSYKRCMADLELVSQKKEPQELKFVPLDPGAKIDPLPANRKNQKSLTAADALGVKATTPTVDKEQQSYTGYVKGSFKGAQGGLSTFTVDNKQGGNDAIARIYLNGAKPAVRSMYVRSGETFKADSLSPGNYVLRYRFIGSEDTYEADQVMSLKQIDGESGTKYSNVTVTLFKQVGGNLSTKKVSSDQF